MNIEKVSYSEAESFLSCKRKHFYGYIKNGGLKPVATATALAAGTFVHAILEVYYSICLAAGDTSKEQRAAHREAVDAARAYYDEQIKSGAAVDSPRSDHRSIEEALFTFYFPNEPLVRAGWVIQAVELKISLVVELDEDTSFMYPFVIDLIAVSPDGKTVVVDHKYLYNFYDGGDADLLTQLPKYLAGLRAGGYPADYAMYNMIRKRSKKGAVPEDVVRTLPVRPTTHQVVDVFTEQVTVANEIIGIREGGEEGAEIGAYRSASTITCGMCDFKDICTSERVGADIGPALALDFTIKSSEPFEADIVIN